MASPLDNPFLNKGTAFTLDERKQYNLQGLIPSKVESIEEQEQKILNQLNKLETPIDKHHYLMSIYADNRTLFFYTIERHVKEMLPIIYTPTIAEAVRGFSEKYSSFQDAAYLSVNEPENLESSLRNAAKDLKDVKLMVITDGEGVLGIGDWGINGAAISIGKLAVYTVAAGINPSQVLPVVIDAGTNNAELLKSPDYLGHKQNRLEGESYLSFIEKFVQTATQLFPHVLLHWEDFGRGHAEEILNTYSQSHCTFNDDIQGTGIMMVAALNSVVKITRKPLSDQKIMIFGAGTAGVGIADMIYMELLAKGLSSEEAKQRIVLYDRYGVIHTGQSNLTKGQSRYVIPEEILPAISDSLLEAVHAFKPTVLIGSSGQTGAFSKEVIKAMYQYNSRPAVFPISNPSELAEAKAEDIIKWTEGNGLVVTGSPTEPFEYGEHTYAIGQANNALLYPGLGQGLVLTESHHVTDGMLLAAAHSINDMQDFSEPGEALLPDVSQLREVSKLVATAVVKKAVEDKVNRVSIDDPEKVVEENTWGAEY
ncbi:NAD-dependent malic enzyme [Alkalibacterium psychrotolerans]